MVMIGIYLLMAKKSLAKNQSVLGTLSLGNISADFNQAENQEFMDMFMILVMIIMLLQLMTY